MKSTIESGLLGSNLSYNKPNGASNRRSDQTVRNAIDDIQDLLFDPQAPQKIFSILLEHISTITDSDYSVSFLADAKGIDTIESNIEISLSAVYTKTPTAFIKEQTLRHWVKQKILPLRPTFFNAPIHASYQTLLIHPEQVSSIIILPIVSQNKLRSICILGKNKGNYSGNMIQRLMPLLGSVVCALQTADTIKGNASNFDKTIIDNRYLNSLLSTSPTAVVVVDKENKILIANPAAHDIFCLPNNSIELTKQPIEVFIPDFTSLFQWSNQQSRYGNDNQQDGPQIWENQTAKRLDGTDFIVNMTLFRYTHGADRYTTLQIQDITSIRESAEEYQKTAQELSALTHLVPVGIIRVDANWNCIYANDKWFEFSGLINEETNGQHWINALHSDEVKNLLEELREALQLGTDYHKEIRLVSPLGQVKWMDFNTRVLFNESGAVIGFLGTFQDVTERLAHQEKLRHIAEYDALTGLANRSLFQNRLEQAFYRSERDATEISVMFLDLDGFKDINDTHGHDVGDLLLQQVAERLLNVLRRNDTVARFGGDEFVILLGDNEHANEINRVATKIIDVIAEPYQLNLQEAFVTISIGVAKGTYLNSSPKQILKHADAALYLAKREGKNNFQLFSTSIDSESQQRIKLANQLRYAISNNRYQLLYQAIADIKTQKILGFEALLRFKDNDDKIIGPTEFIPILEETGMVIDAGKWVIEETCRQLRQWQNNGDFPENGFLSFNVSPKQLLDENIVNTITNACELYSIDPQHLVMEITETVIISKPQKVEKVLAELKKIGLRLALDDFGTGYSSLSYLQKYPFDHIKVDRSFVEDLLTDKNDAAITKAIISLAQSLGLKVTAEGVINNECLDMLMEFGADHYQGYFLSKPAVAKSTVFETIDASDNVVPFSLNKK